MVPIQLHAMSTACVCVYGCMHVHQIIFGSIEPIIRSSAMRAKRKKRLYARVHEGSNYVTRTLIQLNMITICAYSQPIESEMCAAAKKKEYQVSRISACML